MHSALKNKPGQTSSTISNSFASVKSLKDLIFRKIEVQLQRDGFSIVHQDEQRPWGGFFVIAEQEAKQFAHFYFDSSTIEHLKVTDRISPKVLLVEPGQRLSWQYHHRRAEIWKVVRGTVGVVTSPTDEEGELKTYQPGETITLQQGERHRLVGLQEWGVIAEIWQHTDAANPSNEEDIVRVQDDFGR